MASRAQNVFTFRRANYHGQKTGEHADPDYGEKYHPGKGGKSISDPFKGAKAYEWGAKKVVETLRERGQYLETVIKGLAAPKTESALLTLIEKLQKDTTLISRFSPEGQYLDAQDIARHRQYKGADDFAGLSVFGNEVLEILKSKK